MQSVTTTPPAGYVGAGSKVAFTLKPSAPVTVTGTPALRVNFGNDAFYDAAASTSTSLVFTVTVLSDQSAAPVAITAVEAADNAITDAAGNPVDLSGAVASFPGLFVDTTRPDAVYLQRGYAPGQAAIPFGTALPGDDEAPTALLTATVNNLPTNGTVTLADGTTPVSEGQVLSAEQFAGLEFKPSAAGANTGSELRTTISDPAGNTTFGDVEIYVAPANTVVLPGVRAQYAIYPTGHDANGTAAGPSGMQALSGFTAFATDDGIGVFDPTGVAGEVARILQVTDGNYAPSSLPQLTYYANQISSGATSLTQYANGASNSVNFLVGGFRPPTNQHFVDGLYSRALGQAPDPAGEQFWTGQLAAGVSRGQVLLGFTDSQANKQNTAATTGDTDRSEAYRLYQAAFNRAPDAQGLDFWTQQLDTGSTPLAVATGFVTSAEFARDFTSTDHASVVARLYENVLHRAPDAPGQQYWLGQLDAGGSLAGVLLGFSDSTENRAATAGTTHDGTVFIPNK